MLDLKKIIINSITSEHFRSTYKSSTCSMVHAHTDFTMEPKRWKYISTMCKIARVAKLIFGGLIPAKNIWHGRHRMTYSIDKLRAA